MIRNLLYAIFIHLILFLIVYFTFINDFNKPHKLEHKLQVFIEKNKLNPQEINSKTIEEIKTDISGRWKARKFKKLTLKEKLDLYKIAKRKNAKIEPIVKSNEFENIFYYIETPLYISKNKLTKDEIKQIEKNNEIKQEIRRVIKLNKKEHLFARNRNINNYTSSQLIRIAQKPVIIRGRNKQLIINSKEQVSYDIIAEVLLGAKHISDITQKFSEQEISEIQSNEIFTKDDWRKLVEAETLRKKMEKYNLTAREKANIQRQIKGCYKKAIVQSDVDSSLVIDATVKLDREGYINMDKVKIVDKGIYSSQSDYQMAVDNVKIALIFCNPIKDLPAKKYIMWNEMTFTFDSQSVRD